MATIKVKVQSVARFNNAGVISVRFTTKEQFDDYAKQIDPATGEVTFVETKVNHFRFTLRQLLHNVNLAMPMQAFYFGGVSNVAEITQVELRNLFVGSVITIERNKVAAGTEYDAADGSKQVTKRDAYTTNVISCETCDLNDKFVLGEPITKVDLLKAIQ